MCIFGKYERVVEWHGDTGNFPRAFKLYKEYWDQPTMMGSFGENHDYSMSYTKTNFSSYLGLELPDFETMFAYQDSTTLKKVTGCECGAHHDRHFLNVHSFWCPKWRKI